MTFTYTPYVLPLAAAAGVMAMLLRVGWTQRRDPVSRWFVATIIVMVVWAIGYMLEITADRLEDKLFFANAQFVGAGTAWMCWWETVRRYLGLKPPPQLVTSLLWAVAAGTVLVAFVNPWHVFRGDPIIMTGIAPFPVMDADYGPWYNFVLLPVAGLVILATMGVLVRAMVHVSKRRRRQYLLLFLAVALPLISVVFYVFGLGPWPNFNPTVVVSGISGILLAVGLFRWRLFSVVPLARGLVVENLTDAVIAVDADGLLADLNPAGERILSLQAVDVVGKPAREALAAFPVLAGLFGDDCQEPSATGSAEMALKRDGEEHHYALIWSPVKRRGRRPIGRAVVLHDVTERVRLTEEIRRLANTDDLTGLTNRRRFMELARLELERTRRYGTSASLIVADVDHFKLVNDSYGHQMGDLVLRAVAEACLRTLRRVDIMGRLGGEEFAVLLPQTSLPRAVLAAERLRAAVASIAPEIAGVEMGVRVTLSAGVTEFLSGTDADNLDSILSRADKAMYQAKSRGRNGVVSALPPSARPAAPRADVPAPVGASRSSAI